LTKKSILWLSDGCYLTTGYATITRKALNYLTELGWDTNHLSHTAQHQTMMAGTTLEDNEILNFKIYGAGIQPYCQDIMTQRIRELDVRIFGILLDTFMCYPWLLNIDLTPAKSFFYFPSDGGGFPLGCEQILRKVDLPIAMSKYAQKQVKELFNIDSEYIPHAIETDVYKPLNEQERATGKAKMGLTGKFVVGVVARNQGRKMLDRTLKSFAIFARQVPEAILLLHCDKFDPAGYFNFDVLINQLKIQNRVVFTGTRYFKGFNYKQMNELYNVMDLFFLGTSGEGFGVPLIEAMGAGIPVLTTDYTTGQEIIADNKAGELIKLKDELLGNWNVERGLMDIQDGADKMLKLYKDKQLMREYSNNGRSAVLRDYDWRLVSKKWDEVLTKLAK